MRHEDIDIGGCLVHVVSRDNAQRHAGQGRAGPGGPGGRAADAAVCRLPEPQSTGLSIRTTCSSTCGLLPSGRPMTYPAAYDLVTAAAFPRTGIAFSPHWCRTRTRPGCKGAELHQMQHSAVRVNTRCLRRSVRPCDALGLPGGRRDRGDLGLHSPPGSDATMMQLIPLRGPHHRCTCWHRDAPGSSRLHRAHHRQAQRPAHGRHRSCEARAGLPHHWSRHAPDLPTSRSGCT